MTTAMMRIRVPAPLKTALQKCAEENDRSMNAQLVQILKTHFGQRVPKKIDATKKGNPHVGG